MTEKLYYQNVYQKEFDSVVTASCEAKTGYNITLSETAFYPEGGGQPSDIGELRLPSGETVKVTEVHEKDGEILHRTAVPVPVGTKVHGVIDWDVRFDHMQQHSGEHIVSGMICSRFHCDNVGFHMGSDVVTIDYNAEITLEEILALEKEANRYLWENHKICINYPSKEELKSIDYRSKKEIEGQVRIVSFPGADTCACCGTHVENSAEVGLIKFLSAVKFHDGTRFEMLSGKRAMDYLSACYAEGKAVGIALNAKPTEISPIVKKMQQEFGEAKVALSKTEDEYDKIYAETFRGQDDVLLIKESPATKDSARKLSTAISEVTGHRAAVFMGEGNAWQYAVTDPEADIRGFIKDMNTALSGRGGGKGGFAQGSCTASKKEIEAFFSKE